MCVWQLVRISHHNLPPLSDWILQQQALSYTLGNFGFDHHALACKPTCIQATSTFEAYQPVPKSSFFLLMNPSPLCIACCHLTLSLEFTASLNARGVSTSSNSIQNA